MIAKYFTNEKGSDVRCTLCPHNCLIKEGKSGVCRIRINKGGKLIAESYRKCSAVSFDPIEKKPLYHFYPGKSILSIGSVGCNMHCYWCQNCDISQVGVQETNRLTEFTPQDLLRVAQSRSDNIGIAFTYNEPLIHIESYMEVASLFSENGFKNVVVSNGYISQEALKEYLNVIDAFNIDVKGFDEKKYRHYTGGGLKEVLTNLKRINNAGKHLEITYLVVTGVNDSEIEFRDFIEWVKTNLGRNTVVHLSRYFPRHKFDAEPTSLDKLIELAKIASEKLFFTYVGNIYSKEYKNTTCPVCNRRLITRLGYMVNIDRKIINGKCPECGAKVYISE